MRETSDSGFLGTVATLHTQLLEDGSMLQVRGRDEGQGATRNLLGCGGDSKRLAQHRHCEGAAACALKLAGSGAPVLVTR